MKNGNFKTRDFSPFIERVLTGVNRFMRIKFLYKNCTLSVAELKCSISVRNVLEAEVRDSALLFPPLGGALVLGSRQQRIC